MDIWIYGLRYMDMWIETYGYIDIDIDAYIGEEYKMKWMDP